MPITNNPKAINTVALVKVQESLSEHVIAMADPHDCWYTKQGCRLTGILVSGVLLLVDNSGSPSIVEQS